MITIGDSFVYGLADPKPAKGFPAGRLRWRTHADDFAKAYIRTPNGVRVFNVLEKDGAWQPGHEIQRQNDPT